MGRFVGNWRPGPHLTFGAGNVEAIFCICTMHIPVKAKDQGNLLQVLANRKRVNGLTGSVQVFTTVRCLLTSAGLVWLSY